MARNGLGSTHRKQHRRNTQNVHKRHKHRAKRRMKLPQQRRQGSRTRRSRSGFGQNLLHSAGEGQRPRGCKPGKQQYKSQNDENPGLVPRCDRTPQTHDGNQKHQGLATQQTGLWDRNDHRCGVQVFPNLPERGRAQHCKKRHREWQCREYGCCC